MLYDVNWVWRRGDKEVPEIVTEFSPYVLIYHVILLSYLVTDKYLVCSNLFVSYPELSHRKRNSLSVAERFRRSRCIYTKSFSYFFSLLRFPAGMV